MNKIDETDYKTVVKEELIIEDEPINSEEEEINEIFVKQEQELIIEDELDPVEEEEYTRDSPQPDKKEANFACSICLKTFEKTYELARHARAHNNKSKRVVEFHCEHCGKAFDSKTLYIKHLRRHRPHIFKCNLCPKTYPEKFNLTRHLKVKHEIQTTNSASNSLTIEEELTTKDFSLDDECIERNDSPDTRGQIDPFRYCEKCDKTFKTKEYCNTHKRRHKNIDKGLYRCIPCEKSFGSKFKLNLHEKSAPHKRIVEPKEDEEHHCTFCDKIFHSKIPFSKHLKRHRPRNFHCSLCPKSFPVNCDLTRHLRHVHMVLSPTPNASKMNSGSSKQESIENGSSSSGEGDDLLQKMPLAGTKDEDVNCCEICKKVFKYRKSYENHMQRHVLGMKNKGTSTE